MNLPHDRSCFAYRLTALAVTCTFVAGCGGGGGGGAGGETGTPAAPTPVVAIAPSSQFKGLRLSNAPGAGAVASDWEASSCSDNRQKNWVRSSLNENYLFYRDAPLLSLDPNTYQGSVENLFLDYTTRGVPAKDSFSFVLKQAAADATFQSGTATSVGFTLRRDANNGSIIRIAFVDPAGPAAVAGFARGMVLASVDGVPTAQDLPAAQSNKLFASAPGTTATVGVQDVIGGPVRQIRVATALFSTTPLLADRILPGTRTAYIAYNSFSTPIGEVQLADAFRRFAAAGVTDLVVDLRYNGGGFLDISAQLGYMVAGAARSAGKVFEMLAYNDKRTLENVTVPFRAAITNFLGNNARAGELLAALNLQRVFVLTSGSTCSASESFINSLLGVDMQVILIGGTTCGKPYGSSRDDNCTLSYFAIEFEGRNHKGAVTPVTGITPTCAVNDDLDRPLGDPSERMLGAALTWQSTGACPVTTAIRAAVPVVGVVGVTGSIVGATMTEKKRDWLVTSSPLDSIKLVRKQP